MVKKIMEIEKNLTRLERKNSEFEKENKKLKRMLIFILSGLFILPFLFLTTCSSSSEVLRVRRLVLVDENGVERIQIGSPVPDPIIQGKRAKRTMPLTGITIHDANGNECGGYGVLDNGMVVLGIDDPNIGERINFWAYPNGDAGLMMKTGKKQIASVMLRVEKEGAPSLSFRDKDGKVRAMIGLDTIDEAPKLELYDSQGKIIFQLPK